MAAIFGDVTDTKLVTLLKHGSVGVMPSDTIYGLMCVASDEAAVERLYALKKREHKPGTVIAASIDQLVELGLKRRYLTAVEQYWPGPVSVIIPGGDPKTSYLRQDATGLAVRVVADKKLIRLLKKTGPLLTSSANHPGEKPSDTIMEAEVAFGKELDFYVDGGNLSKRKPSTLIRVVDDAVEVLRPGAYTIKQ